MIYDHVVFGYGFRTEKFLQELLAKSELCVCVRFHVSAENVPVNIGTTGAFLCIPVIYYLFIYLFYLFIYVFIYLFMFILLLFIQLCYYLFMHYLLYIHLFFKVFFGNYTCYQIMRGEYKVSRIHSRIALGVLTSICWFSLHLGTFGPWMAKRNLHARACWYLSKSEAKRTLVACWTTMTIWYLDIFRRKRSACLVLLWTLQISSNDEHAISQGDFCGAQVFASSTITVAVQT